MTPLPRFFHLSNPVKNTLSRKLIRADLLRAEALDIVIRKRRWCLQTMVL